MLTFPGMALTGFAADVWKKHFVSSISYFLSFLGIISLYFLQFYYFFNEFLFSKTKTECNNAVKHNQGIKETFSTGSQNQNPPQPNS